MHGLRNEKVSIWLVPRDGINNYFVLCSVKAKKENRNLQRILSSFWHNHSPLLTVFQHGEEMF